MTKTKLKILSREALGLAKGRVPAIVDERILPQVLDEVSDYVGELMGKLTNLPPDDEIALIMAHGIIRDKLITEIIDQLKENMYDEAAERLKNFSVT